MASEGTKVAEYSATHTSLCESTMIISGYPMTAVKMWESISVNVKFHTSEYGRTSVTLSKCGTVQQNCSKYSVSRSREGSEVKLV